MKIIDYIIVEKLASHEFTSSVCVMLEKGWQPYGSFYNDGDYYYQPMVLYEDVKPTEPKVNKTPEPIEADYIGLFPYGFVKKLRNDIKDLNDLVMRYQNTGYRHRNEKREFEKRINIYRNIIFDCIKSGVFSEGTTPSEYINNLEHQYNTAFEIGALQTIFDGIVSFYEQKLQPSENGQTKND